MSEQIGKVQCWIERGAYKGYEFSLKRDPGAPSREEDDIILSTFFSGSKHGIALQIGLPFNCDAAQFTMGRVKKLREELDKFITRYEKVGETKSKEEEKES